MRFLSLIFILVLLVPCIARADNELIRDAEIEAYLRKLGAPIFDAAGIDQSAVHIMIIENDTINAFVAGGTNMFLNTGLLTETNTPEMLIGVMAHETGHIASGHLLRGVEPMKEAQMGAIISFVLGAAAAASGAGQAGMAMITGGPEIAQRSMLAYTRANERAADALGMQFLDDERHETLPNDHVHDITHETIIADVDAISSAETSEPVEREMTQDEAPPEKPLRRPRRVSTQAASADGSAASTGSPSVSESAPEDDNRPKRSGWWRKVVPG